MDSRTVVVYFRTPHYLAIRTVALCHAIPLLTNSSHEISRQIPAITPNTFTEYRSYEEHPFTTIKGHTDLYKEYRPEE